MMQPVAHTLSISMQRLAGEDLRLRGFPALAGGEPLLWAPRRHMEETSCALRHWRLALLGLAMTACAATGLLLVAQLPLRSFVQGLRGESEPEQFFPLFGFRLSNRSLGRQHTPGLAFLRCHDVLQQGDGAHIPLIPNRRVGGSPGPGGQPPWSLDILAADVPGQRGNVKSWTTVVGVIVNLVHKSQHAALLAYLASWASTWPSWEEYLLTEAANPRLAVLYVVTSFGAAQDAHSLDSLMQLLELTAHPSFEL